MSEATAARSPHHHIGFVLVLNCIGIFVMIGLAIDGMGDIAKPFPFFSFALSLSPTLLVIGTMDDYYLLYSFFGTRRRLSTAPPAFLSWTVISICVLFLFPLFISYCLLLRSGWRWICRFFFSWCSGVVAWWVMGSFLFLTFLCV